MKKPLLLLLCLVLISSLASGVQVSNVEVLELGDNGFVVGFETDVAAPGHIWFGKTGALGDFSPITTDVSTQHQVQVDGLDPGTVYFYRAAGRVDGSYYTSAISLTRTAQISGNSASSEASTGANSNQDSSSGTSSTTDPRIPNVWPSVSTQNVGSKPTQSFTLTSASQLSNSANANKVAIVSSNINLGGATITPANGLWIQANGGIISNGKLAGSSYTIDPSSKRTLFASSLTFSTLYKKPFYSEWYGAKGNDAGNDATAIKAAIDASTNVHLQNQKYILSGISLSRSGDVKIMGNNAIFEPPKIDISNYMIVIEHQFGNFVIEDVTIDGKEKLCRGIRARSGFFADNIEIRNLYGPNWCVGLYMQQAKANDPFDLSLRNSYIHDIAADEDGKIASSTGFARGFFWDRSRPVTGSAAVIENSRIGNIYGDDGDVLSTHDSSSYGGGYDHDSWLYAHNSYFYDGSRRVWKTFGSNVYASNNVFKFIANNDPKKAVASAGMISFGPYASAGDVRAKNLILHNNIFDNTGEHGNGMIYFGNARNVEMIGNKFINTNINPFRFVDGFVVKDNEFVNAHIGPYTLSFTPKIKDVQVTNNKVLYTASRVGGEPGTSSFIQLWSNGIYTNWMIENNVMERESGTSYANGGFLTIPGSSTATNVVERNNNFAKVSIDQSYTYPFVSATS